MVSLSEITSDADHFAVELAARLAGEEENRFQGMPSDGDSRAGYRAMGEAGWIGLHWPQELGGRGLDPLLTVAAEERFGYHWLPLSSYLLSVKTIGNAMLDHAPFELQERLLPDIAAGRLVFCQGFSEREAGSDLAALRTVARRDGDRYIVSGHKIWTSSAQLADWIYLAVLTDPDAARPHRGISVLVAAMDSPGIEVREIEVVGGGVLNEVFLDDVSVPSSQLVGEENGGWRVLMSTLDHERVTSEKIGIVLRVLEDLEAAGAPALELRRLRGEAQAARLLGRRAVSLIASGRPAASAAAMAKLSMSTLSKRTADAGTRLLGPRALIEDGPQAVGEGRLAGVTRSTAGSSIAGGASEIQRRVIARQGLGVRRVTTSAAQLAAADEAAQFAATVAAIASRHAGADPWKPGAAASDANPALAEALREAGWEELGSDPGLLPLAAPAGAALGRAFASLAYVDGLLGGALRVGSLARYASEGAVLVEPLRGHLHVSGCEQFTRIPYTDALGVGVVAKAAPAREESGARMAAWVAASMGYLAGMSEEALRLALEHARSRRAFGGPLSALEPVQQMLADAATLVDGLTLLSRDSPGLDALAHAGDAAERAVTICMQVTGALGFTMEFPLQRAYRRSRSARAWNEAVIAAWEVPPP